MIVPVLVLGAGRYLDVSGIVIPAEYTLSADEIAAQRRLDPDFDPVVAAAPGSAEFLTDDRRQYWSEVAQSGGHDLTALMQV